MKILHIITKSNWGGAQKYVFDLALYSHKKGDGTAVALGGNGVLKEYLDKEGIRNHIIDSMTRDINAGKDTLSLKKIFSIIKKERPDIVHLHSPKAAGLGAFASRLLGIKKIIYTVHGFAWNEARPVHEKASIAFFTWITMLLSTHIIILSERELGQAQLLPFVNKKLRLIPLGINPPKFLIKKRAREFLESKSGKIFDSKVNIIGTIAELHPNKGLLYAINAFDKIKDKFPSLVYIIIGEGEQRESIEKLIKEKNLNERVILLGNIENASQYLKAFGIFILSSIKEGLPYVILEAGHAGLPVIATVVGGVGEMIDDMKSGILIQSKKSEEIASAIELILENKKRIW